MPIKEQLETYEGAIEVSFQGLPAVKLVSVRMPKHTNWFMRIAESTRRRFFTLEKDWHIDLDGIGYNEDLNGRITIKRAAANGEEIIYDGASIPFPWLVSFLTIGILRPLGAMLVASIVHDFAFKFGTLHVTNEKGESKEVTIERHHADRLFRDMLQTINRTFPVEWVAWFAVRLGWLFGIDYAGVAYGGKKPAWVIAITSLTVIPLAMGLLFFRKEIAPVLDAALTVGTILYLVFYLATVAVLWQKRQFGGAENRKSKSVPST